MGNILQNSLDVTYEHPYPKEIGIRVWKSPTCNPARDLINYFLT